MHWFDVDKAGLAKLLEHRGKAVAILELLQNAWDQQVTRVDVTIERIPGTPFVTIAVEDDDPEGFANLTHAFTLFAESAKKNDPEKRGRFNLGEKLVLACCSKAQIVSTTGAVTFDESGRHISRTCKRAVGSRFQGAMRMTTTEVAEAIAQVRRCLPPVPTYINGDLLPPREAVAFWSDSLQTEIADAEGFLRRVQRTTRISAFEVLPGETGTLYELGIPVVETGDRWHVSIHQKVPLTLDRTNVPPAYLRTVRVGLLNALSAQITKDDATAPWVREAASHPDVANSALEQVMDLRFGTRRVAYDPSDVEANRIATANGYTVIPGGALSAGEWQNVKQSAIVKPAGQVTPSPKPFSPDGKPLRYVETPTADMKVFIGWVQELAKALLGVETMRVVLVDDPGWGFGGCYRSGEIHVNVAKYGGGRFFAGGPSAEVIALVIHEFAHHYAPGHLTTEFYDACCDIGARLALHYRARLS